MDNKATLLPPYTGNDASCPKCAFSSKDPFLERQFGEGAHAIRTIYYKEPRKQSPLLEDKASTNPLVALFGGHQHNHSHDAPDLGLQPDEECLVRVCQRCTFYWPEATVDTPNFDVMV